MSLPGIEVPIEKLLPKILGRLGKEKPSKRRRKYAFVDRKFGVTSSVSVQFLYALYNNQAETSVRMPNICECSTHTGTMIVSEFLQQSGTLPSPA